MEKCQVFHTWQQKADQVSVYDNDLDYDRALRSFVAQAVAGVFSAKIASDRSGLYSSRHCDIWQFDDKATGEAAEHHDLKNHHEEACASQYARNCYNFSDPTRTLSCRISYYQDDYQPWKFLSHTQDSVMGRSSQQANFGGRRVHASDFMPQNPSIPILSLDG